MLVHLFIKYTSTKQLEIYLFHDLYVPPRLVLNLGSRNLRQLDPSLRMMTARANTAAQSFLVLARERLARSPAAVWHDASDDCVHRGAGGGDGS